MNATPQASTPESAGENQSRQAKWVSELWAALRHAQDALTLMADNGRNCYNLGGAIQLLSKVIEAEREQKEAQPATTVQGQKELAVVAIEAFDAARQFIESHVADPDITAEMVDKYACYQEASEQLKRVMTQGARVSSGATDATTVSQTVPSGNEEHTVYVRANDPAARELLKRAVKWIDRLNERKASIPHFFDNDTDPAPLAKDIRAYLKTGGQP